MIRAIPATIATLCALGVVSACGSDADHAAPVTETVTVEGSPGATGAPTTAAGGTATVTVTQAPASAAAPSFDCAKAGSEAEKLVCKDPELAALDRTLADDYQKALSRPGSDKDMLLSTQNGWVSGRDDCWKEADLGRCVREAYLTRIFELRSTDGAVQEAPVVSYDCPDGRALTAQFYNDVDPQVAVLKLGADTAITFAQPAASGARYGRTGVDFWEHQGEVKVNFSGDEFTCRTR